MIIFWKFVLSFSLLGWMLCVKIFEIFQKKKKISIKWLKLGQFIKKKKADLGGKFVPNKLAFIAQYYFLVSVKFIQVLIHLLEV